MVIFRIFSFALVLFVPSDAINALCVLRVFLGTPRLTYQHEKNMPKQGCLKDLFHIIPVSKALFTTLYTNNVLENLKVIFITWWHSNMWKVLICQCNKRNFNDVWWLFLQVGGDPNLEVERRRKEETYPLQPYLLGIGTPRNINRIFLVLGDSKLVALHHTATPIHALDLLFKTFFTLSSFYPLGWKNVFRFVQVYVYEIPLENKRESTFSDKYNILMKAM